MATVANVVNPVNTTSIAAQTAPTTQAVADGLPTYRIYRNSDNLGYRSPTDTSYSVSGGPQLGEAGFVLGSPQDPAPAVSRSLPPGMAQPGPFQLPDQKLQLETSQYIPGKGWVNSATS